ncbi:hypothetical protein DPMN_136880 [Dreissena polymorpha]|uniref:Uncharacterized protein n=1 Tax=Dreissena polymorpha TaxID=45954 RepID=A0A9D4G0V2_DREPO|nr:hypothetical protein DPMN_136880 [Dreissena polymorpha]
MLSSPTWCLYGRWKECSHSGDRTRDLPVARRTPYPLHHGDLNTDLKVQCKQCKCSHSTFAESVFHEEDLAHTSSSLKLPGISLTQKSVSVLWPRGFAQAKNYAYTCMTYCSSTQTKLKANLAASKIRSPSQFGISCLCFLEAELKRGLDLSLNHQLIGIQYKEVKLQVWMK